MNFTFKCFSLNCVQSVQLINCCCLLGVCGSCIFITFLLANSIFAWNCDTHTVKQMQSDSRISFISSTVIIENHISKKKKICACIAFYNLHELIVVFAWNMPRTEVKQMFHPMAAIWYAAYIVCVAAFVSSWSCVSLFATNPIWNVLTVWLFYETKEEKRKFQRRKSHSAVTFSACK